MAQNQQVIPLQWLGGAECDAVATGNNAAWMCPCGRKLPLLGRTHGSPGEMPANFRVVWPACRREYIVDPADNAPLGKAIKAREIPTTHK